MRNWFQSFAFKFDLYRYAEGIETAVNISWACEEQRRRWLLRRGSASASASAAAAADDDDPLRLRVPCPTVMMPSEVGGAAQVRESSCDP